MKQIVLALALMAASCVPTTPTSVQPYQPSASDWAEATVLVAQKLKDPGS